MTGTLKYVGIIVLLITTQCAVAQKSEEKRVKKAFDNYKTAILNGNGEDAVQYVDSRTVSYYSGILDLVKTADSATIETLSVLDKLMVFSVKHRTLREEILHFDGKSLIVHAIQSGMVGKNSVAGNAIGEVTLDNDFAKGQLIANGEKSPFYFHFYKEDAQWKIDLTSIFPVSNMAVKKLADESELGTNEYLFYLLEMTTGKKPGPDLWHPVR